MSNTEAAVNPTLGTCITKVRQQSIELVDRNDVKYCWALLDQLFPRRFFYRLGITSQYSGGKGKPRHGTKRPYGSEQRLAFNTDKLNPEEKETYCKKNEL